MRNGDAGNRAGMPDYSSGVRGRNLHGSVAGASSLTARRKDSRRKSQKLMEAVVERENMLKALRRVEANKGSAGVDGVSVDALRASLREHWPRIKEELLDGRYHSPSPFERLKYPNRAGRECDNWAFPR